MFCPKCAAQNVEGASFCRACGANISLVPQALTGQIPAPTQTDNSMDRRSQRRHRRGKGEPTVDEAVRHMIMAVGFVVVAFLVARFAPAGHIWWFWMLIPAFGMFGMGIAELIRCKQKKQISSNSAQQPQLNSVRPANLAAPKTGELMTPVPSVTEGTTRHLGAEAPTRHLDS